MRMRIAFRIKEKLYRFRIVSNPVYSHSGSIQMKMFNITDRDHRLLLSGMKLSSLQLIKYANKCLDLHFCEL